jgi:hypothetical protein
MVAVEHSLFIVITRFPVTALPVIVFRLFIFKL